MLQCFKSVYLMSLLCLEDKMLCTNISHCKFICYLYCQCDTTVNLLIYLRNIPFFLFVSFKKNISIIKILIIRQSLLYSACIHCRTCDSQKQQEHCLKISHTKKSRPCLKPLKRLTKHRKRDILAQSQNGQINRCIKRLGFCTTS